MGGPYHDSSCHLHLLGGGIQCAWCFRINVKMSCAKIYNLVLTPLSRMARTKSSCSSAGRWSSMLALVIVAFLIVSVLCQIVTHRTPYTNRTVPETFAQKVVASLIYVYMDGCGHCKQFDPTWTSFTRKYSDALAQAGVSARKVKGDDAGVKDLGINGFPTVVMLSQTNDFPQKTFDGDRSVSGLASFVHDSFPSFTP